MSEAEVLDVEVKMNRLLEDIPIRLILKDKETPELETKTFLGATTKAPTEERGGATQDASQQYANANGEGEKELKHDTGHPCWGCPS